VLSAATPRPRTVAWPLFQVAAAILLVALGALAGHRLAPGDEVPPEPTRVVPLVPEGRTCAMTRLVTLGLAAMWLVASSTLVPAAQQWGAPPPGYGAAATPAVTVSLGGGGGSATSSLTFGPGRHEELLFFAGERTDRSICIVGASDGPRPALPPDRQPLVIWRVSGTMQSFDGATAMIEIRWRREVLGTGVEPGSDFEETFVWRAEEGASRVLDLIRWVPTPATQCEPRTLDMRFGVSGPDRLREAAIAYDIWLLQPMPSGGRQVERLSTSGAQGSSAAFAFPTLKLDEPQPKPGRPPLSLSMRLEGRIMGRVRPDGRIDLAVDAGRMVGPWGRGLSSGSIGRTRLIVASGETVELEPPPLFGNGNGPYDPVFRDARTAIRVRAKRLW
jgi:hypothetical protein